MRLTENHHRSETSFSEEEALALLRSFLLRRISDGVEVIFEEVPKEAWPRVASRLQAAGLLRHLPDQSEGV